MSGPALRQPHAHHAIHDSAHGEAEELLQLFRRAWAREEFEAAVGVADVLVNHFETRTLTHASEEETGLYQELLARHRELSETIARLTSHHQLMRELTAEIKSLLQATGKISDYPSQLDEIESRFNTLMCINEYHSRSEEHMLAALEAAASTTDPKPVNGF